MSEIEKRPAPLHAVKVRLLPRTQPVMPNGLDVGMQVWRDRNYNQLLARFASARDKGYVVQVAPIKRTLRRDFVMVVKVLKPRPRRTPWYVGAVVASLGVSVSIGLAVWHARYVLATMAGTVLALAFLIWLGTRVSHSGACVGLHCLGCKG